MNAFCSSAPISLPFLTSFFASFAAGLASLPLAAFAGFSALVGSLLLLSAALGCCVLPLASAAFGVCVLPFASTAAGTLLAFLPGGGSLLWFPAAAPMCDAFFPFR